MKLSEFLTLQSVAAQRTRSEQHYRDFQAFQARLLVDYLAQQGIRLQGRSLLDLGSGLGGYSQEFSRQGARVISLDLMQPHLDQHFGILQVTGNAQNLPLRSAAVEIVFCASLIEHVPEPAAILAEISRVLVPGGSAYVSFPPYYSPMGGHEFAPFHYFGERAALRLARRRPDPEWVRVLYGGPERAVSFSNLFKGWGLYRMTISKFRWLVKASGLLCRNISTRYLPVSFVRWPVVGEVLTWHAQFLLAKPEHDLGGSL